MKTKRLAPVVPLLALLGALERRLRQLAMLLGVLEPLTKHRCLVLPVRAAETAAEAAVAAPLGDRARGLRVAAPHLLAELIGGGRHQQHTPFRSATAARFSTASRFNAK
jgi:hypothetical protein